MDGKILKFAALLRKAGVKVSHSEVAECLKSLSLAGLEKDNFFNVLNATLIKDQVDYPVFKKVFNYYFNSDFFGHCEEIMKRWPDLILPVNTGRDCSGFDNLPGSEKGRATGFGQGQGLATEAADNFIHVIKGGNSEQMAMTVKKGIESLGRLKEEDLKDMKEAVRQVKVFLEWNMAVYRIEREAFTVDENILLTWQERIKEMESMLYIELEKALINELGKEALDTILVRENLNELDFYRLSDPQVTEIKKKISKMAHRLATRLSFRKKRSLRGNIDIQRTIRKSMTTGGIPIKPAYRNRYPTRPQIVVLCDISGSVKLFSEFMLQLVYSIQNRFIHARSFVFVDTPDEVTEYLQNREIQEGIKDIYNKARFSKSAFSDYGETFNDYTVKYHNTLDKKTTLLVIGDARNNYHKEQAEYFQQICSQVKKAIWINPEPIERWDKEDSLMHVYGQFCHQVFECRNLQQLDAVAKRIL